MKFKSLLIFLFSLVTFPLSATCNFFIDGELLYWKAHMNDLEYALHVETQIFPADLLLIGRAPLKNLDFQWNPGVRAAIGLEWDTNWQVALVGTYFNAKARGSDSAPTTTGNDFLHTLWFQSFTGFRAESASARWDLDFATVDFLGIYQFNFCRCYYLTPYFGVRAVWIKQRYHIDYENSIFSLSTGGFLSFPGADVRLFSRFHGIGLTAGNDFAISLCRNFFFNGKVAGSLVFGESRVNERINGAFPFPRPPVSLIALQVNVPSTEHFVRANLEAETGFTYASCWKWFTLELSASYFFSVWFDQNDFYNFIFTTTNINVADLADNFTTLDQKKSNLDIQGLVLRAALYY